MRAETRSDVHVHCVLMLPDFNQNWHRRQISFKPFNTKFHQITFTDSPVVSCTQTDGRMERFWQQLRRADNAHEKCHKSKHRNANLEARKIVLGGARALCPATVDFLVCSSEFSPADTGNKISKIGCKSGTVVGEGLPYSKLTTKNRAK
jgi:hypothetical protein